jgi:hypothetical protein
MSEQITICMTGPIMTTLRKLVAAYPGAAPNKIGRALVRVGLRHVLQNPEILAEELRLLQTRGAADTTGDSAQQPGRREDA